MPAPALGFQCRNASSSESSKYQIYGRRERNSDNFAKSSVRQRGSVSSRFANPLQRAETQNTSTSRLRSNSSPSYESDEDHTVEHPVEPRATTAMLPPVMVRVKLYPMRLDDMDSY